jgi:VCBS repeat-containing protein
LTSGSFNDTITTIPTQQLRLIQFLTGNSTVTSQGGSVTFDATANGGLGSFRYTPLQDYWSDVNNPTTFDTFVYRVQDNGYTYGFGGASSSGLGVPSLVTDELSRSNTVTLIVQPSNDIPTVGANLNFEAIEDFGSSSLPGTLPRVITNILAFSNARPGALELDGLTLALRDADLAQSGIQTLRGGSVQLSSQKPNGDYDLTYISPPNFFGNDQVLLTLTDVPAANLNLAPSILDYAINVLVRPTNDGPGGIPDEIHMLEDTTGVILPSIIVANDEVDPHAGSATATRETLGIAGNTPQRPQDIVVKGARLLSGPTGTTFSYGVDGRIRITPPANYYTTVKQGNSFVDVAPPLLIEYDIEDAGISYNANFVAVSDPKPSTGTIFLRVHEVNDNPIGKTHNLTALEDTPLTIVPGDLFASTDLVNGSPFPIAKDSAGVFEDVGPGGIYNASIGLAQTLSLLGVGTVADTRSTITTARGGTVTFDGTNLIYNPPTNFGTAPPDNLTDSFTYVIRDNGQTASLTGGITAGLSLPNVSADPRSSIGTVTLTVNPLNDPPEFFIGADLDLQEDEDRVAKGYYAEADALVIRQFAVGIRGGPATAEDEFNQVVTFALSVVGGNGGIFATVNGQPDIALSSDGTLRVKLAPHASGSATIQVLGTDGEGASATPQTFRVNVNPVNDGPQFVLSPTLVSVGEDSGPASVIVGTNIQAGPTLALDPILGGGERDQTVTLNVALVNPAQSSLFTVPPTISTDGTLSFTPAPNVNIPTGVLLRIFATDNGLSQSPNINRSLNQTLTITILPANDAPIANSDPATGSVYTTSERQALNVTSPGVLGNDTDPDLDVLTVIAINPNGGANSLTGISARGARISAQANGAFTYDPTGVPFFQGLTTNSVITDTFTYQASDGAASTNVATVTITVTGINDQPVAVNDQVRIGVNRVSRIRLLDNDSDIDSRIDISSVAIVSQPLNGRVELLPDGQVQYSPNIDFVGSDSFRYTIADEFGARSAPATVTILVESVPPTLPDRVTTIKDRAVEILPLANDASVYDPATLQVFGSPQHGRVEIDNAGRITYTPNAGYVGGDSFVYSVRERGPNGLESDPTRVTVIVRGSAGQSPASSSADVNVSGTVTTLDALIVINYLNGSGERDVGLLEQRGYFTEFGPFIDADGSGQVQPRDALVVINHLNKAGSSEPSRAYGATSAPVSTTGDIDVFERIYDAVPILDTSARKETPISSSNQQLDELLSVLVGVEDEEEETESVDQFWDLFGQTT